MKIFVFLPDGVGLKNFAYTKFYDIGKRLNNEIIFWNNTAFPLKKELGYEEISTPNSPVNPISDLYKRAKIIIELKLNNKETNDYAYITYIFPSSYKGVKNALKSLFVDFLVWRYSSRKGLKKVLDKIYSLERKTELFQKSLSQLKKEAPDFVFCTNQRPITAVAPLLAAQELQIPTATFIFSWDNLPKATLLVKTDYYFVWSDFMKEELLKYTPSVQRDQVLVTGTPQFEPHLDSSLYLEKEFFFKENKLDSTKQYICFSGDDSTTSPNDEFYLEDTAQIVRGLNKEGFNIGIIFRKCPVDFSGRYKEILDEFKDVIFSVDPVWENIGDSWNTIMPAKKDLALLTNTCKHSFLVLNVASSMVFDFVLHNNPCGYFNYQTEKMNDPKWSTKKMYNFIHFRSMPTKDSVLWLNSKSGIREAILKAYKKEVDISPTKEWFNIITKSPQGNASENIWKTIREILK